MCYGDNEDTAMEQEWAMKQARKEREYQTAYERWMMGLLEMKAYEIEVEPKEANMYDRISRTAAIDAILGSFDVIRAIKELPAVDAAPVVYGRWIDENPDDPLDLRMRCSICTEVETPLMKWRYCPNCGARMDGYGDE